MIRTCRIESCKFIGDESLFKKGLQYVDNCEKRLELFNLNIAAIDIVIKSRNIPVNC